MCGRYTLQATPEELAKQFHAEIDDASLLKPRYNIAPSQDVAVVRLKPDTTKRELVRLHWGLIPSWAKDPMAQRTCETTRGCVLVAEKFVGHSIAESANGYNEFMSKLVGRDSFTLSVIDVNKYLPI